MTHTPLVVGRNTKNAVGVYKLGNRVLKLRCNVV